MDPSEGRPYIEASHEELPPLYKSVNNTDSQNSPSPCSQINRNLLHFKAFYYFFYGAIGSLFPFITLYFKHLWLSSTQAGLLIGLRPIVQTFTTPFWAILADRFNAKKVVLFIGLCGWLFAHTCILVVPSGKKPSSCTSNSTNVTKRSVEFSYPPYENSSKEELTPYPAEILDYNPANSRYSSINDIIRKQPSQNSPSTTTHSLHANNSDDQARTSREEFANNDNEKGSWMSISDMHAPVDSWHTFTYIFLIIFVGNIFAAPAQTMANTATLQGLGEETHKYGAQRCFGSIGWGLSAFGVGMLVSMNHDRSLVCKGLNDINYSPCFYAFGIMMLCALVAAIPFKFRNANENHPHETRAHCLQVCRQLDCVTLIVLFTVCMAGFNMGFIQAFLFWHLTSLGGTQHLFSTILAFNAIGEMVGFILSVKLISKFGHLKVLALGFFAYSIRLTVYGVVKNPWLVLTVEFLKAFTSSAVWAGAMSYVGESSHYGSTLTALVHTLYWGVGYGAGGMLGGVLMQAFGAATIFLSLGVMSLTIVIAMLVIVHLDCLPKRRQDMYMPVESDEEELELESDE